MPDENDLFLEIFSGDVVNIVKQINMKKSGIFKDMKVTKMESKSSY